MSYRQMMLALDRVSFLLSFHSSFEIRLHPYIYSVSLPVSLIYSSDDILLMLSKIKILEFYFKAEFKSVRSNKQVNMFEFLIVEH